MIKKVYFFLLISLISNFLIAHTTALSFTISGSMGNMLTCIKTSLVFSVTANTNNSISCTWVGQLTGTLTGNPITFTVADIYTVTVQDLVTSETATQQMPILQNITPPSVNSPTSVLTTTCSTGDQDYSIYVSPTFPLSTLYYTYQWQQTNLGILTALNTNTVIIGDVGTYTFVVTNSVTGCSTSVVYTVDCSPVSVEENENPLSTIKAYPNPVVDKFTIIHKNELRVSGVLTNSFGEELKRMEAIEEKQEFDLSNFPQGVYFLTIQSENSKHFFKLLKQ